MTCVDSHVCWGFSQQESGLEMERSQSCVELQQEHPRFGVFNKTQQEGRGEETLAKGRVTTVLTLLDYRLSSIPPS